MKPGVPHKVDIMSYGLLTLCARPVYPQRGGRKKDGEDGMGGEINSLVVPEILTLNHTLSASAQQVLISSCSTDRDRRVWDGDRMHSPGRRSGT
jgi:hypothetical protein